MDELHHYIYRTQFIDSTGQTFLFDGHMWGQDGAPLTEADMQEFFLKELADKKGVSGIIFEYFNWTDIPMGASKDTEAGQ